MRVTFVHPMHALLPGGGGKVVHEYANYLARRGHTVNIIFPCPSEVDADLKTLRYRARERGDWWKARTSATVRRLMGKSALRWMPLDPRIDLYFLPSLDSRLIPDSDAIFATYWQTAEAVEKYPSNKGTKFYLIQHYETWGGPKDRVDRTWLAPFHKMVVSRWLHEVGESLGARNMRYITNALDHDQFRVLNPGQARELSVLSMYQRAPWKGADDVLAIFGRLHERYPSLRMTMFGLDLRPPQIPAWIDYVRNPRANHLRDLYNAHCIYIGASREEGWGLPPAEAMACGCAFVGTDIGGFREYAINGLTALLSAPGDRDAMFKNVCRVIENSNLLNRLQTTGTEHIRQFTWEKSGAKLEAYVHEVLGTVSASDFQERPGMNTSA